MSSDLKIVKMLTNGFALPVSVEGFDDFIDEKLGTGLFKCEETCELHTLEDLFQSKLTLCDRAENTLASIGPNLFFFLLSLQSRHFRLVPLSEHLEVGGCH